MHGLSGLSKNGSPAKENAQPKFASTRTSKRASIRINLKDWRVLHAVVDCGTFASAANVLNMSQPAVSYTVAKLEEQIGIVLFRQEGRKACLTPMGKALAERSRALVKEAYEVEEFAANLMKTWRQNIRLLVDRGFPTALLLKTLRQFALRHHYVNVSLTECSTSEIGQTLTEGTAELAITSRIPGGMTESYAIEMHFIPVAQPNHPLFRLGRELDSTDLAGEKEVRVATEPNDSVTSAAKSNIEFDESPNPTWLVHNFDSAINIVVEGLAYGWLPKNRVAELVAQKKLRVLPLHGQRDRTSTYYLVSKRGFDANTEVKCLLMELQESIQEAIWTTVGTS